MNQDIFQETIAYQFKRSKLLEQALTHRSYSSNLNNERLEFLGDSILNLVISRYIYLARPDASEGELSRMRASLVNEEALAQVARDIDLGEYISLGGGELKSGGSRRASILSDTMEAIFGAIYLDSGFSQAQQTILFLYDEYLRKLPDAEALKDPKTRLQEYLQSQQIELPKYNVSKTTGKSHDQTFTVTCIIDALKLNTSGKGSSRKKAEHAAADSALHRLNR